MFSFSCGKKNKTGSVLLMAFWVLLLYIHVHAPVYNGSIYTFRFLFLFSIIYSVVYFKDFSCYLKSFKKELGYVFLFIAYTSFRTLLGGDSMFIVVWIRSIIELFVVPFSFIHMMHKEGAHDISDLRKVYIILGCLGAVITTICILNPGINLYVRDHWWVFEDDEYLNNLTYRCFGISDNLTFSYGLIQGIILLLILVYYTEIKWSIVFIPFMAISILLNARVGFVITLGGFIIYLIFTKHKNIKSLFGLFLFLGVSVYTVVYFLGKNIDESGIMWLKDFFNEFNAVKGGDVEDTTVGALTKSMVIWPQSIEEWFIGKGVLMFRTNSQNSDVGYILQLNYGGLMYVIPLYLFIYHMFKRLRKNGYKVLSLVFLFIIVAANLKGEVFPYNGAFRLIFIYYSFLLSTSFFQKRFNLINNI